MELFQRLKRYRSLTHSKALSNLGVNKNRREWNQNLNQSQKIKLTRVKIKKFINFLLEIRLKSNLVWDKIIGVVT